LISGLDTLLSNSLGTKNFYLFGLYAHRARLITYMIYFIISLFHYMYGLSIIELFGIDKITLQYCRRYITPSLIYTFFIIQFSVNYRILCIFEKTMASIIILAIPTFLHPVWCHIFINVLGKNIYGAGISMIISQAIAAVLITLYMHFNNPQKETYFMINSDCFSGWYEYIKFTLPSAFMILADALAIEIQAVFAVFMSKQDYALHILISNIANLLITLAHGFGIAATILIAEYMAKSMIKESKQIALYSFILAETLMSFVVILLMLFRNSVLKFFIDDEDLLTKGSVLVVVLAIEEIFDMTQGVLGCIYKGLGKQRQASIITFLQFYVIQILLSYVLGIKMKLGVVGIWISILLGNLISTLIYIFFIFRFNFEQIIKETTERLEKDQKLISRLNIVEVDKL
jgi:MATE family multidrug resistance protein